ncbi:MAG: hypothetical protein KAH97_01380 [Anaerolineales bacterium]|nr:hypothetical protein [Anaerolineales bacterium]
MAALPIIIFFLFAVLIRLLKKSHIRNIWILTLTSFVLGWIASYALTQFTPTTLELSNWASSTIFPSGLNIELNRLSITLVQSLITLGLVIILTFDASKSSDGPKQLFVMCIIGGFGLLTIIPGNLVTFCITWTLWEIVIFSIDLFEHESPRSINARPHGINTRMLSVFLVLAAGAMIATESFETRSLSGLQHEIIFIFLLIAGLIRIEHVTRSVSDGSSTRDRVTIELWMRVITMASGFALVSYALDYGISPNLSIVLVGFGMVISVIGILSSNYNHPLVIRTLKFPLVLLGVGTLIELANTAEISGAIALFGSMSILIFASMLLREKNPRLHPIAILLITVCLIGAPGTIGGIVIEQVAGIVFKLKDYFIGGIVLLFLVGTGIRLIYASGRESDSLQEGIRTLSDSRSIMFSAIVPGSALLSGIFIIPSITPGGIGIFLGLSMILGVTTYIFMIKGVVVDVSFPTIISQNALRMIGKIWTRIISLLASIVEGTSRIFEGRAGLLWVYVIALYVVVALGIAGTK